MSALRKADWEHISCVCLHPLYISVVRIWLKPQHKHTLHASDPVATRGILLSLSNWSLDNQLAKSVLVSQQAHCTLQGQSVSADLCLQRFIYILTNSPYNIIVYMMDLCNTLCWAQPHSFSLSIEPFLNRRSLKPVLFALICIRTHREEGL